MSAVLREAHDRFRVRFAELERGGLLGLFRPPAREVDPFLICRAIVEIMRQASLRSPAGRTLLWNEYRMLLPAADLEPLRPLELRLRRELEAELAAEAARLGAEVAGDLRVHLVADESGELAAGEAVVRVGFGRDAFAVGAGDMTVQISGHTISGAIENATVLPDTSPAARACRLSWAGGAASLPPGVQSRIGRPHAGAPDRFVALAGASARISKQHLWVTPGPAAIAIGRFAGANPVEVAGELIAAGQAIEVAELPVDISLSRGDLILQLSWA